MDSNEDTILCSTVNSSTALSYTLLNHTDSSPSLLRLSQNLSSLFSSSLFSDVKLAFPSHPDLPLHRCILSSRSSFFRNLFRTTDAEEENDDGNSVKKKKKRRRKRYEVGDLFKEYEIGYEAAVCVLEYLYSGRVREKVDVKDRLKFVCVDDDCCCHVACRPVIDFMVDVLYGSFVFDVPELVSLFQGRLLDVLDKAAPDDVLVILSVANKCSQACGNLLARCIESVTKSDVDVVTLDKTLPQHIAKQINESRLEHGVGPENNSFPDKHVKRIHRALDSDDVELVRMLLKEGHTTIDDAHALHYAVAYCDAKTTTEILDLGIADVNLRNCRGYTVLHVAAMRREPKIIVSLLTKGARPSDLTLDGRNALQIAKRLTRAADFHKAIEEGMASPKDRLCIEVLEQAERRAPLLGEASSTLAMAGEDMRMKLLYLENRVGLAKLLFPMEAKVAMDIAQVDGTSEFPFVGSQYRSLAGTKRTIVDLNETPFKLQEEHLNRLRALSKTVELGKRFFPRCSEVLNKIMDADDLSQLAYTGNITPEGEHHKKRRYLELQELLSKAFSEDKEEFDRSVISSSSSTSLGIGFRDSQT